MNLAKIHPCPECKAPPVIESDGPIVTVGIDHKPNCSVLKDELRAFLLACMNADAVKEKP